MEFLQQLKELLAGLNGRQRVVLAVSAVVVVGVLAGFTGLIGTGDYRTLYAELSESETQAVTQQLAARQIPYTLSAGGSAVSVPSGRIDEARLLLAAEGLPRSGRLGFELFDVPNWGGSNFTDKVNYQRALEGEIERTLQTMQGVLAARVHLALPKESLFTERRREGKAAVVLKLRGGQISNDTTFAVANLVAGAVEGLDPASVTVVNADGSAPLLAQGQGGASANRIPTALEANLEAKLLATLAPVVGEDNVRASVNVEYDLATVEDRSESADSAANKTTRHNTQPGGRIRRITAAVLIDDDAGPAVPRQRTPEEMRKIETLARAAFGFDEARGDFLAVENISFQVVPLAEPVATSQTGQIFQWLERWPSAARYAALVLLFLLVYFLVLRPLQKQVVHTLAQGHAKTQEISEEFAPPDAAERGATGAAVPPAASAGGQAALLQQRLVEKARREPAMASRVLQTWLHQPETQG